MVPYTRNLDPGGRAALRLLQTQARPPDRATGVADFRRAWGYQFDEPPPAGSWLIDLDCKGALPRVHGASRVPVPALRLRVRGENDVTPTLRGSVSVPGATGVFRFSAQDRADLSSVAARLLSLSGEFVPLPKVVAMINRARRP